MRRFMCTRETAMRSLTRAMSKAAHLQAQVVVLAATPRLSCFAKKLTTRNYLAKLSSSLTSSEILSSTVCNGVKLLHSFSHFDQPGGNRFWLRCYRWTAGRKTVSRFDGYFSSDDGGDERD